MLVQGDLGPLRLQHATLHIADGTVPLMGAFHTTVLVRQVGSMLPSGYRHSEALTVSYSAYNRAETSP
jgi:hypothetical protein